MKKETKGGREKRRKKVAGGGSIGSEIYLYNLWWEIDCVMKERKKGKKGRTGGTVAE